MKGIDRLELQGRKELTDVWIVFLPFEIDTSGVFRKGPCRKTRHDGLACPGPPERRSGLHAKNVKPRACQAPKPNAPQVFAIAIGQEQRSSANLIQDASGIATENAATDRHLYEFMRSAIGEVSVAAIWKQRKSSSVNFWPPETSAMGQVTSDTMTRCPFEHVDDFPLRPRPQIEGHP